MTPVDVPPKRLRYPPLFCCSCTADVRLTGTTTFSLNYGNWGGAIFNQVVKSPFFGDEDDKPRIPTITFPDDTVFEDNYGQVSEPWQDRDGFVVVDN